ncbi:MAG TPA: GreA/GreB family elongation factor [Gemmatimonadales bacterium]|jgi:transcription elongation factor GreA|nr:GreA/GreB family elongation factor [Gemmatimonadales bacterium]
MIDAMRSKLGKEIEALTYELNVTLPRAIATAVEMGDLRENSEYKSALERQQFVQARLGQLHQRLAQLAQLAGTEAPTDRVGLGSEVVVLDLDTSETDTYTLVLAEMMDLDAGHISLASPLGRALKDRQVGEEVRLRLPNGARRLKVVELRTVYDQAGG